MRLVVKKRLLNDVKSSGAVSPAIRASASTTPVMMPGSGRGQDDAEDRARAGGAERQRAFAHRARHEQQQFFGRPRDDRDHHDAQRQCRRPAR